MKKSKKTVEKVIAKIAYASAKKASNETCYYFFGQSKMPEQVKKLRKF